MPFISSGHFMDMMFSGGTASCNGGTDVTFASLAMTPTQVANMGPGTILHQTMEVDNHNLDDKWMAFDVVPASDPLQSWEPDLHRANNQAQALFVDMLEHRMDVRIFNGSTTASFTSMPVALGQMYVPTDLMPDGKGFDDRSRFDIFISQTHMALFEDNYLVFQQDIPASAMPWFNGALKSYFVHYEYHSDNGLHFLRWEEVGGRYECYPMNAYWFNDPVHGLATGDTACGTAYPPGYGFPYSDERHWDNMGFEVIPPSATSPTDFSSLMNYVKTPAIQTPQFTTISGTPVPTATFRPTPNPSAPTPTPSPTPTPTPNPASPPTPTVSVPSCINAGYSGSGVTISWTAASPVVSVVDIGLDNNFITTYGKFVSSGALSVTGPVGFSTGSNNLTLNPNTNYFTRTYNGTRSAVVSFSIPACGNPTPVPTPTPTSTPGTCPKASFGDIDCNGNIDIFDFNTLISNFGKSVPVNTQGDLDGDGKIGIFDFNILLGNFGK
jgi:hypothetical protein